VRHSLVAAALSMAGSLMLAACSGVPTYVDGSGPLDSLGSPAAEAGRGVGQPVIGEARGLGDILPLCVVPERLPDGVTAPASVTVFTVEPLAVDPGIELIGGLVHPFDFSVDSSYGPGFPPESNTQRFLPMGSTVLVPACGDESSEVPAVEIVLGVLPLDARGGELRGVQIEFSFDDGEHRYLKVPGVVVQVCGSEMTDTCP